MVLTTAAAAKVALSLPNSCRSVCSRYIAPGSTTLTNRISSSTTPRSVFSVCSFSASMLGNTLVPLRLDAEFVIPIDLGHEDAHHGRLHAGRVAGRAARNLLAQ
jgi:hypothetical protein